MEDVLFDHVSLLMYARPKWTTLNEHDFDRSTTCHHHNQQTSFLEEQQNTTSKNDAANKVPAESSEEGVAKAYTISVELSEDAKEKYSSPSALLNWMSGKKENGAPKDGPPKLVDGASNVLSSTHSVLMDPDIGKITGPHTTIDPKLANHLEGKGMDGAADSIPFFKTLKKTEEYQEKGLMGGMVGMSKNIGLGNNAEYGNRNLIRQNQMKGAMEGCANDPTSCDFKSMAGAGGGMLMDSTVGQFTRSLQTGQKVFKNLDLNMDLSLDGIGKNFNKIGNKVQEKFTGLYENAKGVLEQSVEKATVIYDKSKQAITEAGQNIYQKGKESLESVQNFGKDLQKNAEQTLESVKKYGNQAADYAEAAWNTVVTSYASMLGQIAQAIPPLIKYVGQAVAMAAKFVGQLSTVVVKIAGKLLSVIKWYAKRMKARLKAVAKVIQAAYKFTVEKVIPFMTSTWNNYIVPQFTNIGNEISDLATTASAQFAQAGTMMVDQFEQMQPAIEAKLSEISETIQTTVTDKIDDAKDFAENAAENAGETLSALPGTVLDHVVETGNTAIEQVGPDGGTGAMVGIVAAGAVAGVGAKMAMKGSMNMLKDSMMEKGKGLLKSGAGEPAGSIVQRKFDLGSDTGHHASDGMRQIVTHEDNNSHPPLSTILNPPHSNMSPENEAAVRRMQKAKDFDEVAEIPDLDDHAIEQNEESTTFNESQIINKNNGTSSNLQGTDLPGSALSTSKTSKQTGNPGMGQGAKVVKVTSMYAPFRSMKKKITSFTQSIPRLGGKLKDLYGGSADAPGGYPSTIKKQPIIIGDTDLNSRKAYGSIEEKDVKPLAPHFFAPGTVRNKTNTSIGNGLSSMLKNKVIGGSLDTVTNFIKNQIWSPPEKQVKPKEVDTVSILNDAEDLLDTNYELISKKFPSFEKNIDKFHEIASQSRSCKNPQHCAVLQDAAEKTFLRVEKGMKDIDAYKVEQEKSFGYYCAVSNGCAPGCRGPCNQFIDRGAGQYLNMRKYDNFINDVRHPDVWKWDTKPGVKEHVQKQAQALMKAIDHSMPVKHGFIPGKGDVELPGELYEFKPTAANIIKRGLVPQSERLAWVNRDRNISQFFFKRHGYVEMPADGGYISSKRFQQMPKLPPNHGGTRFPRPIYYFPNDGILPDYIRHNQGSSLGLFTSQHKEIFQHVPHDAKTRQHIKWRENGADRSEQDWYF